MSQNVAENRLDSRPRALQVLNSVEFCANLERPALAFSDGERPCAAFFFLLKTRIKSNQINQMRPRFFFCLAAARAASRSSQARGE